LHTISHRHYPNSSSYSSSSSNHSINGVQGARNQRNGENHENGLFASNESSDDSYERQLLERDKSNKIINLTEEVNKLQQLKKELESQNLALQRSLLHNAIYFPHPLDWSARGIATPAELIFDHMTKINCFEEPQTFGTQFFTRILEVFSRETNRDTEFREVMYWFSASLGLMHLLHSVLDFLPDPKLMGVKSLTHPIPNKENDPINHLISFGIGLQKIALGQYEKMLALICSRLETETLVSSFLGRSNDKKLAEGVNSKEFIVVFDTFLGQMRECKVFDIIAHHFFTQVTTYIDETVFIEILALRKIFLTDGVSLKMQASEVEHWWCEKMNHGPIMMKHLWEVAMLLLSDREKLESESHLHSTYPNLKPSQILQILEAYRYEKKIGKQISNNLAKILQNMIRANPAENQVPFKSNAMNVHLHNSFYW